MFREPVLAAWELIGKAGDASAAGFIFICIFSNSFPDI